MSALPATVSPVGIDALDRVNRAADTVKNLEPRLRQAREELHAAILDAANAGVSPAVISRVSGLTKQRISQLLARAR